MSTAPVCLVTGASRGLGAAIARHLGRAGWAVGVNYRSDGNGADRVVADIRTAGGRAEALHADVTDESGVGHLVTATRSRLGPVRALVLNATGAQPQVSLAELTWRQQLDHLEFFVKSPLLLLRASRDDLRASGAGRVVLIGSDAVRRTVPGTSAYVTAKAAQEGMARVWAKELGPERITVNVVAPGWIPVERHAGVDPSGYAATVPMGRMGVPEDVAGAVGYLLSDAAAFVTGQVLTVNGGQVL